MAIIGNSLDIAWQNEIELKTGLTISSSSELSTMPWTNVKNQVPSKKGRTNASTTLVLTFDFGEAVNVSHTILTAHNLTALAGVTIEGATDAGFSASLFTAGVTVVVANPVISNFTAISRRYWRWSITDAGNSDGYIEAGHTFFGVRDQFELPDFSIVWERLDPSVNVRALNGALTSFTRSKFRRIELPLGAFQQTAHRVLQDIFDDRGRGKGAYFIIDPDSVHDTEGLQRETVFGTFVQGLRITHRQSIWHQPDNIIIEELRG